jgi:hypothetical protein
MPQNKYRVRLKQPSMQFKPDNKHPFRLRYIGTQPYKGFDDNGNTPVNCKEMEVIEVSRIKANQLLADFPMSWVIVGPMPSDLVDVLPG